MAAAAAEPKSKDASTQTDGNLEKQENTESLISAALLIMDECARRHVLCGCDHHKTHIDVTVLQTKENEAALAKEPAIVGNQLARIKWMTIEEATHFVSADADW
jgi:hypothetical protein